MVEQGRVARRVRSRIRSDLDRCGMLILWNVEWKASLIANITRGENNEEFNIILKVARKFLNKLPVTHILIRITL